MMVGCRAFSSDQEANNFFNLIPHCVAFGETCGTAAALSVKAGCTPRQLPFKDLRKQLIAQNVPLPGAYPAKYAKKEGETSVFQAAGWGGGPAPAAGGPPKPQH